MASPRRKPWQLRRPIGRARRNGGPVALTTQPFFLSIQLHVNPLVPTLETPGGLVTPGDRGFTPAIFNPLTPGRLSLPLPRGRRLRVAKPPADATSLIPATPVMLMGCELKMAWPRATAARGESGRLSRPGVKGVKIAGVNPRSPGVHEPTRSFKRGTQRVGRWS